MYKKLGFGCMRLPMKGEEVDYEEFNKMIDLYMEEGFNYFDTAHGYIDGKSETAIRDCLAARYPRESYILTNKLTGNYFKSESEIVPFFEEQLNCTGVEYFDYYLMHALNAERYEFFKDCNAFEVAKKLKSEGKIKHIGISFHDTADVLDKILAEQPDIEIVQIQFNYLDYESPTVQSRKLYEVCRKYNKPMLIMEPVRGGELAKLPGKAKKVFDSLGRKYSYASYAIRYADSFEGVYMVLSGMSDMEQMKDNLSYMKEFKSFTPTEYEAVKKVTDILLSLKGIACTSCRYCAAGCPKDIPIPDLFECYNLKKKFNDNSSKEKYELYTRDKGKASDCISCRQCEKVCPQNLGIVRYLKDVSEIFE